MRATIATRIATASAALILLALAAQPAGADDPDTASITVTVAGLRSQDGQILVLLFDDERAFPMRPDLAAQAKQVAIGGERVTFRLDDVRRGTYALSLIHDEDGDDELDTNLLGIPREGLGVSNNPTGGIPRFRDAAFDIDGGHPAMTIWLRYL
jgi:uncharacterized protein (DUF2141 family)